MEVESGREGGIGLDVLPASCAAIVSCSAGLVRTSSSKKASCAGGIPRYGRAGPSSAGNPHVELGRLLRWQELIPACRVVVVRLAGFSCSTFCVDFSTVARWIPLFSGPRRGLTSELCCLSRRE